jgi:hypothetical protein
MKKVLSIFGVFMISTIMVSCGPRKFCDNAIHNKINKMLSHFDCD